MNMLILAAILNAPIVSDSTFVRIAPMGAEPVVDNVITPEEEGGASTHYSGISSETGLMAVRYAVFHLGWTEKGLYFATRTGVPAKPQTMTEDDAVSLVLLPPGAQEPRTFRFPLAKAARRLKGIADYGVRCCEFETIVPFGAATGLAAPKPGEKWGVNMSVDFSSTRERASWHYAKAADELGTVVFDPSAPTPSLLTFFPLEEWRSSGNAHMIFRFNNRTDSPAKIVSKSVIHRGVSTSKLDSEPEAAPEIAHVPLHMVTKIDAKPHERAEGMQILYNLWPGTVQILDVDFSDGKGPLFRRKIRWDLAKGLAWKDAKGLPTVRSAFFPCLDNRLRVEVNPNKVRDLTEGELRVVGQKSGRTFWSQKLEAKPYVRYAKLDFHLPKDLPLDDYRVEFAARDKAGNAYRDASTFSVASFPWQTAHLGEDRVIVPPYVPIKIGKSKVEGEQWRNQISFLQTGYRCRGVLWDEVYAKGENILAGPVSLKLNGEEFKVQSSKFIEVSPDRVIREVTAVLQTSQTPQTSQTSLTVRQDYAYDGFCWVKASFSCDAPCAVKTLQLTLPLKTKVAKYYNVLFSDERRDGPAPSRVLKDGEGEVWNSHTDHNSARHREYYKAFFQPYIWFGGAMKGMCWMTDRVKDYSLEKGAAAQRIVRSGDATALVCDFVTVPVEWTGEKVFEFGFQPTPVKPKDPSHGQFAQLMYTYACPSNALGFGTRGDGFYYSALKTPVHTYPNGDKSLRDWTFAQKKVDAKAYDAKLREYIDRNRAALLAAPSTSPTEFYWHNHSRYREMGHRLNLCYLNPMLITSFWPEWEMYKSEWYPMEWPEDDYCNEYMAQVSKSKIDKLMWDVRQALLDGADGVYYDCFAPRGAWGLSAYPNVYTLPDGSVFPQLSNFLAWREIMKRSAVICLKMGRTFNGRPVVEDHDTAGNVVPIMSFCMTCLSTERGSRGGEFPIRFPEGYTLANVVGAQSGKGTRFIVSGKYGKTEAENESVLHSLIGYMCAYGCFSIVDQGLIHRDWFEKAWNIPFDYGWGKPEVEQFQYWNEEKAVPVTHTGRNVRVSVGRKKDSALVMFGNLGDAENITFDLAGLGFGSDAKVTDAETGKPFEGTKLSLDRFGYRMLLVTAGR